MAPPHENVGFCHDPIPPRTIRLVQIRLGSSGTIECGLINIPLTLEGGKQRDIFEYKAVSYAWGSNERSNDIEMEGKRFPVTRNLYSLLCDLRLVEREDEYFWIDDICINQENDNEEKSQQVQMMGEIYNSANEVVIYLGKSNGPDNFLFPCLKDMDLETRGIRHWPPADKQWNLAWKKVQAIIGKRFQIQNLRERQVQVLQSILQKPWFFRAWIIQEVAKAESAAVIYDCQRVSTRIFALAPRLLGVELNEHQQAVFDLMPGPLRRFSWWSHDRDLGCGRLLYTLLRKFSAAKATRDRDRIYALLVYAMKGFPALFFNHPTYSRRERSFLEQSYTYILCPWISLSPRIKHSRARYVLASSEIWTVQGASTGFYGKYTN